MWQLRKTKKVTGMITDVVNLNNLSENQAGVDGRRFRKSVYRMQPFLVRKT